MLLRLLSLSATLLLSACASTPPNQFYLLEAAPTTATLNTASSTAPRLGIGTIVLPDYLNRPQIVLRDHGGRLLLRERERWAEPLEDGVRRTLGENLGQLLG
ncbi:membrane integrity-associated transporter subunit PqiC, partial [Azonexus sp.]|uniref:PqiC family protein n=1 Tax=Azonexus sp. TaxID=1872668 RepID=UPI0039E24FBB